jgi:hypothetical protein
MTLDVNGYAQAYGSAALRAAMDTPSPPHGWSLLADHAITVPRLLVKGLLPYKGIAFIGGQSGAGKSFIEVDLAVALASQTPFFNRKVNERVGVAIVAAEGGEQMGNRLRAAAHARGQDVKHLPIAWKGDAPLLKSAKDVDALGRTLLELSGYLRAVHGVRLGAAFLDTVAAALDLEDEDKNSEVAKAIRKMRQLSALFGGLLIPLHHYGKTAVTGLRGGSAWRAGADVVLSVIAERKELTGEIAGRELALAKARDGIEGPIAPFALKPVELGIDHDGDPFGTCIVEAQFGAPLLTARKKVRKQSRGVRTFNASFMEALNHGETLKIGSDGPTVRAVSLAHVRSIFNQQYATAATENPKKRGDTLRKAFTRALDETATQYRTLARGDTEWIWSVSSLSAEQRNSAAAIESS